MHELSCSVACGNFPDQGLNPCLLHWQEDSLPRAREAQTSVLVLVPQASGFMFQSLVSSFVK